MIVIRDLSERIKEHERPIRDKKNDTGLSKHSTSFNHNHSLKKWHTFKAILKIQ